MTIPWSISTTVRNPERLRDFLRVLKLLEGKPYVASGYNLRLVQKQLGHSSVRVTEVYASLMDKCIKQAVERLYK